MTQNHDKIDYSKIDNDKVSALVEERLPKNLDDEDAARWRKNIRDKILDDYESAGRIDEIMLDSATESDAKENIRSQSSRTAHKNPKSKSVRDWETIQKIPKAQIAAMQQTFPGSANKIDMFSAMVYIVSDGACEISVSAMQLVKAYKKII